jgi:hypothetical protein
LFYNICCYNWKVKKKKKKLKKLAKTGKKLSKTGQKVVKISLHQNKNNGAIVEKVRYCKRRRKKRQWCNSRKSAMVQ